MGYFNANDPKHRDGVKHAVNKPSKRMPVREEQHKFDPKQGAPKPGAKPAAPKVEPPFDKPKAKREVVKPFPTSAEKNGSA